jgi:hypothetical protein
MSMLLFRLRQRSTAADPLTRTDPIAFTSAQSGYWQDVATWTNGIHTPRIAGDTVTIASTHDVTIAAGATIACGAITLAQGTGAGTIDGTSGIETKLHINGQLTISGTMTRNAYSILYGGPGGKLRLNGQNVAVSGTASPTFSVFAGIAGSHFTVEGGPSGRGAFIASANQRIINDWQYTDFSALGDSVFGQAATTARLQRYEYCTFSDMESWFIENSSASNNWGLQFNYCDVRDQHSPTGTDIMAGVIGGGQPLGTRVRQFMNNTFNTTNFTQISWNGFRGVTFTGNVFKNVGLNVINSGATTGLDASDNIFVMLNNNPIFPDPTTLKTVSNNYFYVDGAGNYVGGIANTTWSFTGNIFEQAGGITDVGANWFTNSAGNAISGSIKGNIGIGAGFGNLVTYTSSLAPLLMDVSNNVLYIDNQHSVQGSSPITYYYTPFFNTTGSGVIAGGSHVRIFNNIYYNAGAQANDPLVELISQTAGQLEIVDYNAAWPNGPAAYGQYVNATTTPAGHGTHDFNVTPDFVAATRKLSTWDTSLGGGGTGANAIAELMKRNGTGGTWNTAYTPAAAVAWVKDGFVGQANALDGTGLGGIDVGYNIIPSVVVVTGDVLLLEGDESGDILLSGDEAGGGYEIDVGFGVEANGFLDRTTGLDTTHRNAYGALIDGLIDDGVWAKLEAFYIFATQDEATALLNIRSTLNNATAHNSPPWVANQGYTGGGTRYINTHYNPRAEGLLYLQNDAHWMVRSNTNSAENSCSLGSDAQNLHWVLRYTNNNNFARFHNGGGPSWAGITDSRGNFVVERINSTTKVLYRNGSAVASPLTQVATTIANRDIYILATNQASGVPFLPSARQTAAASFGASLGATLVAAFNTRINDFMTAVGAP